MAVFQMIHAKLLVVKLVLWTVGLCVSAVPLLMSVQAFPGDWNGVFNMASYTAREAEVLYIGIALGAVTIAEIIDLLASMLIEQKKGPVVIPVFILSASLIGILFCAASYGTIAGMRESGDAVPVETLEVVFAFTIGFAVMALISKVIIWSQEVFFTQPYEGKSG